LLSAGKLVVLPTETVYGIAGILTNSSTREAMIRLRKSPEAKPLTIHIARREDALQYVGEMNELGRRMMRKLWPGPVGLMFDVPEERRKEVAARLGVAESDIYDGGAIALRCPDHPVFFDVVSQVREPVVLTAASGLHLRGEEIGPEISEKVEAIYDAGDTRFSKPSTIVRLRGNRHEIVRAGVYDERIIERMLKTTILFVCSGNTCRSPMAEAIARQYLAERLKIPPDDLDRTGINVVSAGSYAMPGSKATPQAVDAVKIMGLDLSRHRSRPLTVELIHQADVIYTMGKGHARAVASLVPSATDKVSTLDPERDIEDPIGGDLSLYTEVADQIKALVERRLGEENIA
jgi:L-threonylcarbamoyladenylate synthase